jgi:hypothetical protein
LSGPIADRFDEAPADAFLAMSGMDREFVQVGQAVDDDRDGESDRDIVHIGRYPKTARRQLFGVKFDGKAILTDLGGELGVLEQVGGALLDCGE